MPDFLVVSLLIIWPIGIWLLMKVLNTSTKDSRR